MTRNGSRAMTMLGAIALLLVVSILLTASGSFFSPTVTFIDSELYGTSGREASVVTRTDFGSAKSVASFPSDLDKWYGIDYDVTEYVKLLGANAILLRRYDPKSFSQPIFFTIVQAQTESSFHPPKRCMISQGYSVQDEGDATVAVTEASWTNGPEALSIPLKKLIVVKKSKDGTVTERRVVLFCYVKGNQFYDDTVTMIQVDALAPLLGSYDDSLRQELDFIGQAIPRMFGPGDMEVRPMLLTIAGWGLPGYVLLLCLLGGPISLILYPVARRRMGAGTH